MTPEQAQVIIESLAQIHQFLIAYGYTSLGVLCGLVFATAWRA